ncbi:MAG: hypothetical protein P8174_07695 [Gemmatimonadota bacterium]
MLITKEAGAMALTSLLLVAAACGDSQDLLSPPSALVQAVIQGAYNEQYDTDHGTFGNGQTAAEGIKTFTIFSGYLEGDVARQILVKRYGDGGLPRGTYSMKLIDLQDPNRSGIRFEFWRTKAWETTDARRERFAADSGTIHVTDARADRVEGTFEIQAFRYCLEKMGRYGYETVEGPCKVPWKTIEDAPRLTITGHFRVVPPVTHLTSAGAGGGLVAAAAIPWFRTARFSPG